MSDDIPAGYVRHPRQEFRGETCEPFFRDYCRTCVDDGECRVQVHLMNLIDKPDQLYWHPSLVALAVHADHPELRDMVMCTQYAKMPQWVVDQQLEFLDALADEVDGGAEPFVFPDPTGEITRHVIDLMHARQ